MKAAEQTKCTGHDNTHPSPSFISIQISDRFFYFIRKSGIEICE